LDTPFPGAFVAGSTDEVHTTLPTDAAGSGVEVGGAVVAVAVGPAVGVGTAALPPHPANRNPHSVAAASTREIADQPDVRCPKAGRVLLIQSNCTAQGAIGTPFLEGRRKIRTIGGRFGSFPMRSPAIPWVMTIRRVG
jgi:hypothetical protein